METFWEENNLHVKIPGALLVLSRSEVASALKRGKHITRARRQRDRQDAALGCAELKAVAFEHGEHVHGHARATQGPVREQVPYGPVPCGPLAAP